MIKINKIDPRVRLLVSVLFSFSIALLQKNKSLIFGLIFSIIFLIISINSYKKFFKRIITLNSFIILLWLILPFSIEGTKVFKIINFIYSYEGIIETLKITTKYNSIIFINYALFNEINLMHLIHSLRHFYLIPEKINMLIYFYCRYLSEIEKELTKLLNALKIRCFKPSTNFHTYKYYAYLVALLFIRTYERAQNIYYAMLCRAFKGKIWIWEHFEFHKSDLIFLFINIFIIILIILI